MIFPELAALGDIALLLLRLLIGAIFGSSGWSHVTKPRERAQQVGLSPAATVLLGVVELLGAALVVLGAFVQIGALLLTGVMLGAIYKKAFVWKTGFWGGETNGWYYDLLYLSCNLVFATIGPGDIAIM